MNFEDYTGPVHWILLLEILVLATNFPIYPISLSDRKALWSWYGYHRRKPVVEEFQLLQLNRRNVATIDNFWQFYWRFVCFHQFCPICYWNLCGYKKKSSSSCFSFQFEQALPNSRHISLLFSLKVCSNWFVVQCAANVLLSNRCVQLDLVNYLPTMVPCNELALLQKKESNT